MALDEACLLSSAERRSLPTLRLFSWEPPTLSLGYAQKSSEVNFQQLHEHGWGLVRRPTGGRAILHTDELTYSVTAPLDDPVMAGSLLESYQRISKALLAALNTPARSSSTRTGPRPRSPPTRSSWRSARRPAASPAGRPTPNLVCTSDEALHWKTCPRAC